MKRFLSLFAAGAAMMVAASAAQAADVYDPSYDWSGVYVTGGIGLGWSNDDWEFLPPPNPVDLDDDKEVAFGGFIGVQKQFSNNLVLGLEGGILGNVGAASGPCANPAFDCVVDDSAVFIIGPKLGFAADRFLFSVSGGYATAKVDTSTPDVATGVNFDTSSERHHGWAIGAAVDYAVTENFIFGLSFKHFDLGSEDHTSNPPGDDREVSVAGNVLMGTLTVKFNPF
jgi:outer membrane immunogenic protein